MPIPLTTWSPPGLSKRTRGEAEQGTDDNAHQSRSVALGGLGGHESQGGTKSITPSIPTFRILTAGR